MATVRVRRLADNHCQLCGAGTGGASAQGRQNGARPKAGAHRKLLPVHLHDRGGTEDRGARVGPACRLLLAQHLEHDGFLRRIHGVSSSKPGGRLCAG